MKTLFTAILAAALAFAQVASAQINHDAAYKSPQTASFASLMGTLIPAFVGVGIACQNSGNNAYFPTFDRASVVAGAAVVGLGFVFGPGLGHLVAGDKSRFVRGTGVRLACAGAITGSVLASPKLDKSGARVVALGACALLVVSMVRDISSADNAARAYNARHALSETSVKPFALISAHGVGGGLRLNF